MAYRDQPLGELALSIPRASALFRKFYSSRFGSVS